MWGIFVCLIPAIGYGCMAPFATKVGGSTQQKTLFITLACLMVGLIVMFCEIPFGLDYLSKAGLFYFALSIISGFCWYLGSFFELKAILGMGVSKALPYSMVGQFITVTLCSAFFFGNWLIRPNEQIPFGLIFIFMIVAGICLISLKPNHSYKNDGIIKENKKRNPLIMILISVFGFFLYFFIPELINNMSNNNSWLYIGEYLKNPNENIKFLHGFDKGIMFPQSLGMFIMALVTWIFFNAKNKKHGSQQIKILKDLKSYKILGIGMFQGIGNLGSIFAILVNTNVIASPMTQFSVVIGTLLGIFYMKEKPPKPYLTITLIGLGLIIVGAISCGFSNVILGIE